MDALREEAVRQSEALRLSQAERSSEFANSASGSNLGSISPMSRSHSGSFIFADSEQLKVDEHGNVLPAMIPLSIQKGITLKQLLEKSE